MEFTSQFLEKQTVEKVPQIMFSILAIHRLKLKGYSAWYLNVCEISEREIRS